MNFYLLIKIVFRKGQHYVSHLRIQLLQHIIGLARESNMVSVAFDFPLEALRQSSSVLNIIFKKDQDIPHPSTISTSLCRVMT